MLHFFRDAFPALTSERARPSFRASLFCPAVFAAAPCMAPCVAAARALSAAIDANAAAP